MFCDLFAFRLEGDDLEEEVVHGLHSFERRELEKLFSFFLFFSVHDRLHKNSVSKMSGIYKAILTTARQAFSHGSTHPALA